MLKTSRSVRRGETVIELLMTYVIPVVGAVIASLFLIRSTGWPRIICIAIGIPVGTILGWIGFIGMLVAIGSILKTKK